MSVKASIAIDGVAGLKPSQIRAAARVAMQAVGDRWIKEFLPRHFTQSATARYGYTPRSLSYRRRKRYGASINGVQSIKEDRPLVWSGRSRERAKGARTEAKAPSSTRAYADVIIDVPALNFRFKGSQINMRDELTRVIPAEAEDLAALFVRIFEREITRLGKTTRRTKLAA
jgi:hypothetical protein